MKWYFASRMRHKESIEKIVNFLKSQNHQVVYEWSKLGSLKPYNKNSDKSSLVAKEISDALKEVDIFVLISDEAGTDMFIELGIVIGRWLDNKKIKIYVVGKFNDRSLMHFHPAIKRIDNLSDVFSGDPMYDVARAYQGFYGLSNLDEFLKGYGEIDKYKFNYYLLFHASVELLFFSEEGVKDWIKKCKEMISVILIN